jgi:hypothetical protein
MFKVDIGTMAVSFRVTELNQLREKLRKLYQFNTASARSFESISSLETALMSALNQVKQSFSNYNPATGFVPPKDMTWVETVNSQWKKREEVVQGYQTALKKIQSGQDLTDADIVAIAAYVKRYPETKVPKKVSNAIEDFETQNGIDVAQIFSGVGWFTVGMVAGAEGVASYKKIMNGTFWRSAVKSTKTGLKTWKQVMGDVNRFKIVKQAKQLDGVVNGTGKFVKGTGFKGAVKSVGVLGGLIAGLDGLTAYQASKARGEDTAGALVDGAVHAGASVTGAIAGAYVGSLIPIPVVGTLVGAWVGSMIGQAISTGILSIIMCKHSSRVEEC